MSQNPPTIFDKDEIERKISAQQDLTDTEKEAAKAKLLEMIDVHTKATVDVEERRDVIKKTWQLLCVGSITSGNTEHALDLYSKLDDDGTRLREIINNAYQQLIIFTPIDVILNFIKSLSKSHLKITGVYALLSAMREKDHLNHVKMLRIQEFVQNDIMPSLSEAELKSNNLYEKLPQKITHYVENTLKSCMTKIHTGERGDLIVFARECPETFEKWLPEILMIAYGSDYIEKLLEFVFVLPTDSLKIIGVKEVFGKMKENSNLNDVDLASLEHKIKDLNDTSLEALLEEVRELHHENHESETTKM